MGDNTLELNRMIDLLQQVVFKLQNGLPVSDPTVDAVLAAIGAEDPTTVQEKLTSVQTKLDELIRLQKGGTGDLAEVTTQNPGTNWTTLSSLACWQVCFSNNTGVDISLRKTGGTVEFVIFSGNMYTFNGIEDADELQIKRTDDDNATVTIQYTTNS